MEDQRRIVLPLAEEQITVAKKIVEKGVVTITTHVEERDEIVRQALRHSNVVVERIVIGEELMEAPAPREQDGVIIVPIFDEIIVVTKRFLLKEELHIHREDHFQDSESNVTLRSIVAEVSRTSSDNLEP